jgi:hypothetical protein
LQAFDGTAKREARPSDRSGTGSSIRGENIAIDPEASRAECSEIRYSSKTTAEKPLNFGGATVNLSS